MARSRNLELEYFEPLENCTRTALVVGALTQELGEKIAVFIETSFNQFYTIINMVTNLTEALTISKVKNLRHAEAAVNSYFDTQQIEGKSH